MKLFICNLLLVFLFTFSVTAQNSAKTEPVLRVEVEGGKSLNLKTKDLTKFTHRDAKGKDHDGKESTYSGVNLSDILLSAGAKIGKDELKGKEQAAYILIEAADGYKAIFSIAELSADFTDKTILLADAREGKPLTEKEGFWQLIVPEDKKHGRWVRQVTVVKLIKIK